MKKLLYLLGFLPFFCVQAQFTDDFSDGDFSSNPVWAGDINKFEVNPAGELWLNAPAVADTAYLTTVSPVINQASWEFYVRLGFSPSTTNFARVYLVSNQSNLKQPVNGYYVLIGQVTSPVSSREISLYRQTGSTSTKIISGITGDFDGMDPLIARVRVTRDAVGNWELYYDKTGSNNFVSMGTAFDNTHTSSSYFGVRCRYTATRSNLFWFDDFVVTGAVVADTVAPVLTGVSVISPTQLRAQFSEPVETNSAADVQNYVINQGVGNPASAVMDPQDVSAVLLTLSSALPQGQVYQISVSGVKDLAGNTMTPATASFALFTPQPGDVVINEIFPDPTPPVGLPEFEYIELHNRTAFPIDLGNWTLTVGSNTRTLPAGLIIQPDSFLVLADPGGQGVFPSSIAIHYLSSWPAITNSGATLVLRDAGAQLMDEVTFTLSYYQDASKNGGGYSIERKTPGEFCGQDKNWSVSLDPSGGTPGRVNSVYASNVTDLLMEDAVAEGPTQILVTFNKDLDVSSIHATDFVIDNGIGNPLNATVIAPGQVRMVLDSVLNAGIIYNITLIDTVKACRGQAATLPQNLDFVFYIPSSFDVVIHEIMVDESPAVGLPQNEWIEIRNRRNFPIPMRNWTLEVGNSVITLPPGRLEPDSVLVLMRSTFVPEYPGIAVMSLNTFPTLPNSSGTISLRAPNGMLVHSLTYSDTWYGSNAKKEGGWSLEMRDPNNPCQGAENWSASVNPLGGTPGYANSIAGINPDTQKPLLLRGGLFLPDTAILYFDERLLPESLNVSDFNIYTQGLQPLDIRLIEPGISRVLLKLPVAPLAGELVPVWITGDVKDCAGNNAPADTVWIGIPETPEENDVIINEVLAAATGANIDFVEIYNRSNKVVDLMQLRLGGYDSLMQEVTSPRVINDWPLHLAPGEYLVLSTNQKTVKSNYNTIAPRNFWDMSSFPSLAKETGNVGLATVALQVIDALVYDKSFQFSLLNSIDNVSMERILQDGPTQDPRNWTSAAQQVGFATPGYRNSQYGKLAPMSGNFTLEPPIFSPDNDGYQDQLFVRYALPEAGFIGTVKVYDAAGREVKTLANNELLGIEGYWVWDGTITDGSKARVGVYAITFEIFAPDGRKDFFKKAVTVATKL